MYHTSESGPCTPFAHRMIRPVAEDLDLLLHSWERRVRQRNRSSRTIRSYFDTVRLREGYGGQPGEELSRDDLGDFFVAMLATRSPASVGVYFRSLRAFYNWLAAE